MNLSLPRLLLVAAALLSPTNLLASDDLLFTASDFPKLVHGVPVEKPGEYTIKIWSPAKISWTMTTDGSKVRLLPKTEGTDETPRWTALERVSLTSGKPLIVEVEKASFVPEEINGSYQSGKQTRRGATNNVPVPVAMSLSTDPKFEADLSLIRSDLTSTAPVEDGRRNNVRTNHEGVNFQAPTDPKVWEARAAELKEQLKVTLGLFPMFPKTPLDPKIHGKVVRDGYSIEKVTLETLPGMYLGGNLYRPIGNCRRVPVVLCPHGHWEEGRVHPDVQARCIRMAKLGLVVFLYDMVGKVDSELFGHEFLNDRLDSWGLSLGTLQTWNSLRVVDWVATLPDVDPARIACTGESGGGTQTFLLSALEPRLAITAPVVMVSERFQGGCSCENASGFRFGTDNVEIAALAAPRPMFLVGASGDWTAHTLTKVHPAIRGVYSTIGAPAEVEAALFDFPHNYNQTSRNAVYAYFGRELLGIDDAKSTIEGEQTPEKYEDLHAFDKENPAPLHTRTPSGLEHDLVALRTSQLDKLAPGTDATLWNAARPSLASAHKIRIALQPRSTADITARQSRSFKRDDLTISHWTVRDDKNGDQVPIVRMTPAKTAGRVAIVFSDRGKAGLVNAKGERIPLVQALLDRGVSVIGFDPLFVGESFDPAKPANRRPRTAHYSTYNRVLAADRMNDLSLVAIWANTQTDVRELSLVGIDGGAPLALLARPLIPGIARTFVDMSGFDFQDGEIPSDLHLPGIFQFGGLKAAAALTAPMPLWVARPAGTFGRNWPANSYNLADAASALRITENAATPGDLAKWIDVGD